jgi:recombination protein RecA
LAERYRPSAEPKASAVETVYFGSKKLEFIPSGCTLLDCEVNGGGADGAWPLGRIVNIVGDRSTGKTLLAEEAMANFLRKYPQGKIWYRETEAAFDESYAQGLGLDTGKIDFGPDGSDTQWATIEDLIEDFRAQLDAFDEKVIARAKAIRELPKNKKMQVREATARALRESQPGLYIIDSLDAVTTEVEQKRDIRQGSYNLEKQKLLGEFFRTETRRIRRARICFIVVSQIRDRIGAMIKGKKYTRTGGKSLDFYASVVLYLSDLGKVYEQVKGIKRPVAIKIKAKCEKNKISMPFRECIFELRFGYGIDDEWASLEWLKETKMLKAAGFDDLPKSLKTVDSNKLREDVKRIWMEIEKGFTPPKGKYAA